MKQPLAGVVALFAAGILVGRWWAPPLIGLFVVTVIAGALTLWPSNRSSGWFCLFLVLAGWTNLSWRTAWLAPHDVRRQMNQVTEELATARGVIRGAPREVLHRGKEGWRTNSLTILELESLRLGSDEEWNASHGRLIVATPGTLPESIYRGCPVTVSGVLRVPSGPMAPGLFDYGEYLRWKGIYFELKTGGPADWEPTAGRQAPPRSWADRFQAWARRTMARGLAPEDVEVSLLWAMVLGWKTGLTEEVEEPFVRSGTLHLFAISGLHVALLAGILVELLRLVRLPRVVAGLLVIPVLWFYAAATGWQPSAVRATLMMTVIVGGWTLARPVNLLNSLAVAALVVLLAEPRELFQAGFQLSFAVVAAIGVVVPPLTRFAERLLQSDPFLPADLVPRWRQWMARPARWLAGSLSVSIACWLGSVPLTAMYFHMVSPVGLFANLVVVPLGTAALASGLGSLACGEWMPAVGECFGHGAWLWMHAARKASEWFAALPVGVWNVRGPPWSGVALWYLVLGGVALGGWRSGPWRRPLAVAGLVLSCATVTAWVRAPDGRELRVVVLPLRGGQSVYVEHPQGPTLVDVGDGASAEGTVRPFLAAQGVDALRLLILTHGDVRHVGGVSNVLDRFPPDRVAASPLKFRSPVYRAVLNSLKEMPAARRTNVARGSHLDGWEVLHPAAEDVFSRADDGCLVLAMRGRRDVGPDSVSLLLASDLGSLGRERVWTRHPDLQVDVLVMGLPTNGEPFGPADLRRLKTRIVVVADASFPATARASPGLKRRLRQGARKVYFTSETGAIELWRDRETWTVRDARGRILGRISVSDEPGIVAGDEIEDGHPDGEPVGDLLEND